MATLTDPAHELGDIAKRLIKSSNAPTEQFLAKEIGVEESSTTFFRVIACILERADLVGRIAAGSEESDEWKEQAAEHVNGIKSAFSVKNLRKSWDSSDCLGQIRDHGRGFLMLSAVVRQQVAYPRFSADEIDEFIDLIDAYLGHLDSDGDDASPVLQAIRDGLERFKFQLKFLGWTGAGYSLAAFRDLQFLYMALDRSNPDLPDAKAVLDGLLGVIKAVKKRVDEAGSWVSTGNALIGYAAGIYSSPMLAPLIGPPPV